MDLKDFVVYDVETAKTPDEVEGGWSNPEGMGFSSAVAYDYSRNQYFMYLGPEEKEDLVELLDGKWAVTFNGIQFDSRVLLGNSRDVSNLSYATSSYGSSKYSWKNYDILFEYVKSRWDLGSFVSVLEKLQDKSIHDGTFTLDGICESMFGLSKIGHGARAPILYREGRISELLTYNLHDIVLTRKLFEFIAEYHYAFGADSRVVRLPWAMGLSNG